MVDARHFASRSSPTPTGVASSGSSVRAAFSPMTEKIAIVSGTTVGISMNRIRKYVAMKPWTASAGSSPAAPGAAAYSAWMSRSLGGLAAAAATAPMPAARMTTGGSSVIATSSRLPSASRHSRMHTARTSAPRSGVRAIANVALTSDPLPEVSSSAGSWATLDDAEIHVLEVHLALDDVRDLSAALDQRANEDRIRPQRIRCRHHDRAVLEMRLPHTLDRPNAQEVLCAWRWHQAELGRTPVELGTQVVGGIDADDRLPEERDAVAKAISFVEVVSAEEHRATLAAYRHDELAHRLGRIRIEAGGGLVEEEHARLVKRGARDGHLLLHTA